MDHSNSSDKTTTYHLRFRPLPQQLLSLLLTHCPHSIALLRISGIIRTGILVTTMPTATRRKSLQSGTPAAAAAAAEDVNENGSVASSTGSLRSRSSARLKRKRVGVPPAEGMRVEPLSEHDEPEEEVPEVSSPERLPPRRAVAGSSRKRRKIASSPPPPTETHPSKGGSDDCKNDDDIAVDDGDLNDPKSLNLSGHDNDDVKMPASHTPRAVDNGEGASAHTATITNGEHSDSLGQVVVAMRNETSPVSHSTSRIAVATTVTAVTATVTASTLPSDGTPRSTTRHALLVASLPSPPPPAFTNEWRFPTTVAQSNHHHHATTTTAALHIPIPTQRQQQQQHSLVLESTTMRQYSTPFKTTQQLAAPSGNLERPEEEQEDHDGTESHPGARMVNDHDGVVDPQPPQGRYGAWSVALAIRENLTENGRNLCGQVKDRLLAQWWWGDQHPDDPAAAEAAAEDEHNDGAAVVVGADDNRHPPKTSPWGRAAVWFVLLFVLQMLFFPLWLNPILSTTVSFSKVALVFYQGILGVSNNSKNIRAVGTEDLEQRRMQLLVQDKLHLLEKLQAQLEVETNAQEEAIFMLNQHSRSVQDIVGQQEMTVSQETLKLKSVKDQLEFVAELDESLIQNPFVTEMAGLLKENNSGSVTLLDLSKLDLWPVRDASERENCGPDGEAVDATATEADGLPVQLLTLADLEAALHDLQSKLRDAVSDIQQNPTTTTAVRSWIRDTIEQHVGQAHLLDTTTAGDSTVSKPNQLLKHRVRKTIATRLAMESADQTGQIDYASTVNGATVLSSSPSLVDNLPLLNRLAALWSIRFYGFGPEAALTPTVPHNALGQCWAFEKQKQAVGDRRKTPFGVLTVRLAKSVYVESVLIEHPPKELSDRSNTAIRKFRVIGFETGNANGKAWPLGSFEYKISSADDDDDHSDSSIRQEFPVVNEVDGEEVPALRIIQLQIDSNWGAEYACLYRFRVHGEEGEEE